MNIFYLSHDTNECAAWHADRHVVKMILEYSQLLSTAHRLLDGVPVLGGQLVIGEKSVQSKLKMRWALPHPQENLLYKETHANHPSAVWARKTDNNYKWLLDLLKKLHDEYTYRYGKIHKSKRLLSQLRFTPKNIPAGEFEPPPQAMPDKYKCEDAIIAYRKYYVEGKSHLAKWKNRQSPPWYLPEENLQIEESVL